MDEGAKGEIDIVTGWYETYMRAKGGMPGWTYEQFGKSHDVFRDFLAAALATHVASLQAQLTATERERDQLQQLINEKLPLYVEQIDGLREAVREAKKIIDHRHGLLHASNCPPCLWLDRPSVQQAVGKEGKP